MARSNSQAGNNSSLQKIGANVLSSHSKLSGAFGSQHQQQQSYNNHKVSMQKEIDQTFDMHGFQERTLPQNQNFDQPAFMNKPDIPLNRRAPPLGKRIPGNNPAHRTTPAPKQLPRQQQNYNQKQQQRYEEPKSRALPPRQPLGKASSGYGIKSRSNANSYANTGNIKVPSRGYNLNNLPPEAFAGGSEQAAQKIFAKSADVQLRQCHSCQRSFNPESLMRHQKICKKVFVQQRKVFNAQAHRMVDQQQKQLVRKANMSIGRSNQKPKGSVVMSNQGPVPKWKAQSHQFRAAMRAARQSDVPQQSYTPQPRGSYGRQAPGGRQPQSKHSYGGRQHQPARGGRMQQQRAPPKYEEPLLQIEEQDDRILCPYCGRKFGEVQVERHMPHCKLKMKDMGKKMKY